MYIIIMNTRNNPCILGSLNGSMEQMKKNMNSKLNKKTEI